MKLLTKLADWKFAQERAKTGDFSAQKEKMVEPIAGAFKVFRKPFFEVTVTDYTGEPDYFYLFGYKVAKKPAFLTKRPWKYTRLKYVYYYGEFHIHTLPIAECVMYGKHVRIHTENPLTNTTSPENYWMSLLEFFDGHGAHKGNLRKTIEKMGMASMGVQFDAYDPHVYEVKGDDFAQLPEFGNSMYYVLDKSYINPEYHAEYDRAIAWLKEYESPLMV